MLKARSLPLSLVFLNPLTIKTTRQMAIDISQDETKSNFINISRFLFPPS
jgi:hypothetical protein